SLDAREGEAVAGFTARHDLTLNFGWLQRDWRENQSSRYSRAPPACEITQQGRFPMILVRDVFRLKFGKAREGLAVWREMSEQGRRSGAMPTPPRILTDLVGPYYTLVMETTAKDLSAWEADMKKVMADPNFHTLYQKFSPLVESGHREIFTIQEI